MKAQHYFDAAREALEKLGDNGYESVVARDKINRALNGIEREHRAECKTNSNLLAKLKSLHDLLD